MTPDISDIDGTCFDPHGFSSAVALGVALLSAASLPLLLARLTRSVRVRRGRATRGTVCAVLAAGGLFWAVLGVLSLRLDAASARLFDPMNAAVKGPSLLEPLGQLLVVVGALCAVAFAAVALTTTKRGSV